MPFKVATSAAAWSIDLAKWAINPMGRPVEDKSPKLHISPETLWVQIHSIEKNIADTIVNAYHTIKDVAARGLRLFIPAEVVRNLQKANGNNFVQWTQSLIANVSRMMSSQHLKIIGVIETHDGGAELIVQPLDDAA